VAKSWKFWAILIPGALVWSVLMYLLNLLIIARGLEWLGH